MNTKSIKQWLNKTPVQFIIGAVVGFIVFYFLFGLGAVNPFNITWIRNINGDLIQHYIGWTYYRHSAFHFPDIGKIDGLAYPTGISLVYMDVIPLFAIIFKLFSGILPATFQYFGIFTLLSYLLQGGFGAVIIQRFTKNPFLPLLGAVFLVCTPIIIGRSFAHTALTAHWLILAPIYFSIVFYQQKSSVKKQTVTWAIFLVLAVLIHAYFIPIVGAVFAFSLILQHSDWRSTLVKIAIPTVCALVVFTLIGGISRGMQVNGDSGLGIYSTNVLAPIISMGYSAFINPPFTHVDWEGLGYFGLGILLLLPVLWFIVIFDKRRSSPGLVARQALLRMKNWRTSLLVLLILIFFIASLSPTIYVGDWHITLRIPHIIKGLWSVFRSTGRLFWPIYYASVISILVFIMRASQKWKAGMIATLLIPFALLQSIDVLASPVVHQKTTDVAVALSEPHQNNQLNSNFIAHYCAKKTVVLTDNSLDAGIAMFNNLSDYIIQCQPALTSGYFARFPKNAILNYANQKRDMLVKGTLSIPADDLYISSSPEFISTIDITKYTTKQFGNYWVISNKG